MQLTYSVGEISHLEETVVSVFHAFVFAESFGHRGTRGSGLGSVSVPVVTHLFVVEIVFFVYFVAYFSLCSVTFFCHGHQWSNA